MHPFFRRIAPRRSHFPFVLRRQPVVVTLAKRVIHFGHHLAQLSLRIVKIKKRNGIEDVSEITQVRQQENLAVGQRYIILSRVSFNSFAQTFCRISKMVALEIRNDIPTSVARKGRSLHDLRNFVHVEQRKKHRIFKRMLLRREPAMPQPSDV